MMNFSRLLQEIKDNPVMYIDKPSITCLHSLLNGYLSSLSHLGFTQEGYATEGFHEWMQERAKTKVSQSWAGIILFLCGSERNAFYSFFELFEKFLKQKDDSKIPENEDVLRLRQDLRFRQFDIYSNRQGG